MSEHDRMEAAERQLHALEMATIAFETSRVYILDQPHGIGVGGRDYRLKPLESALWHQLDALLYLCEAR